MLTHMRTSVDLPDALLARAKRLARRRGTTLRALLEEGLLAVLKSSTDQPFRLPDTTFQGDGLVEGLSETDWGRIRDLAYEGRGS
jgi:predicted transcriptional regulator